MPRERSTAFLLLGIACILGGLAALVGGALPMATIGRWAGPGLLLALGLAGLVRWWPRGRVRQP